MYLYHEITAICERIWERGNFVQTPILALFTISKQWRPLTFFLVCGHIRPSVSQIPCLKLYIAACQIWWPSNRRYKPTTGSRHARHAHTGNGQGLEFLASVAEWLTVASVIRIQSWSCGECMKLPLFWDHINYGLTLRYITVKRTRLF